MVVCIDIWAEPRCDNLAMDCSAFGDASGVAKKAQKASKRHFEGFEYYEKVAGEGMQGYLSKIDKKHYFSSTNKTSDSE